MMERRSVTIRVIYKNSVARRVTKPFYAALVITKLMCISPPLYKKDLDIIGHSVPDVT